MNELKILVKVLQDATATYKSSRIARETSASEKGYNVGIRDYMRSTLKMMPDLDWSVLGEDAKMMVEELKKEEADKAVDL